MNSNSARVNGGHSRRSNDYHLFFAVPAYPSQKTCFACSGFAGEKNVTVGIINQVGREPEHFIVVIWGEHCHEFIWRALKFREYSHETSRNHTKIIIISASYSPFYFSQNLVSD